MEKIIKEEQFHRVPRRIVAKEKEFGKDVLVVYYQHLVRNFLITDRQKKKIKKISI